MPLRRPRSPRPLVLLPGTSPETQKHKHAPEQSSYLIFPPSPTSLRAIPRTPLTPPLRLHLRTVLSSPPLSPQYLASAPEIPYPWIWRCHKCGSIYRLGVTRRCLHDGHFFCSVPPRPETLVSEDDISPSEESSDSAENLLAKEHKIQRKRQENRKQRRRTISCAAEFDYSGWAQYNSWRRSIKICKFEKAQNLRRQGKGGGIVNGDEDEGEDMLEEEYQGQKNCWNDCEFPSECHNNRLQEEIERRQLASLFSESARGDEGGEWGFKGKAMEIEEWKAELQKQKLAEFKRQEEELDRLKFAVAIHGDVPPLSPLSASSSSHSSLSTPASSLSEEIDIVDMERRGLEGSAQMIDVSLGPFSPTDMEDEDDALLMSEFATKKRKKSIQKIAQLTGLMLGVEPVERGYEKEKPRSPLKEGFTFGEWNDVPLGDREREIEEEERTGSILRRRASGGEGRFGDEEDDDGILYVR